MAVEETLAFLNHPKVIELNKLKWLMTKEIKHINEWLLKVTVGEGLVVSAKGKIGSIKVDNEIRNISRSDDVQFSFLKFITYAITEEMYAENKADEISQGDRLRVYSKSNFLDFVSKSTWATDEFPGPIIHYRFITLDHTIDIATSNPPEIS